MANRAKETLPANGTIPANGWAPNYGFLLEANGRAFARWFNGMNALSQEIAQFTQGRLQEDMAAWSALTRCNKPEDAFECQRRFAEKATVGYAAEGTKLWHMMMSLANEGWELHQRGVDAVS